MSIHEFVKNAYVECETFSKVYRKCKRFQINYTNYRFVIGYQAKGNRIDNSAYLYLYVYISNCDVWRGTIAEKTF